MSQRSAATAQEGSATADSEGGFSFLKEQLDRREALARERRARYVPNLVLLLWLVATTSLFVTLHIPDWAQLVLYGGGGTTITLYGAWKLLTQWVPQAKVFEDRRGLAQRVVENRWARLVLFGLSTLMCLLLLTTASVYLDYGGGNSRGSITVEVAYVDADGMRETAQLDVSSSQPLSGDRLWWGFRRWFIPQRAQFVVREPFGYHIQERTVYGWTSLRLRFPDDFRHRAYYVCRLIPGHGLQHLNPRGDETLVSTYGLTVQFGGQQYPPNGAEGVSYDCVYFGAPPQAMDQLRSAETPLDRSGVLQAYLALAGQKTELLPIKSAMLATSYRTLATEPLRPGDQVRVTIVNLKTEKPIHTVELTVPDRPGIHNLVLNLPAVSPKE